MAADEEDYFKEDDDENDTMSCIVGNGVARPPGVVTGGFSLSSLVEYGEDEDDDEDSLKNGARDGERSPTLPLKIRNGRTQQCGTVKIAQVEAHPFLGPHAVSRGRIGLHKLCCPCWQALFPVCLQTVNFPGC